MLQFCTSEYEKYKAQRNICSIKYHFDDICCLSSPIKEKWHMGQQRTDNLKFHFYILKVVKMDVLPVDSHRLKL